MDFETRCLWCGNYTDTKVRRGPRFCSNWCRRQFRFYKNPKRTVDKILLTPRRRLALS